MWYDRILRELQTYISGVMVPETLPTILPALDTATFHLSVTFQNPVHLAEFLALGEAIFGKFQEENGLTFTMIMDQHPDAKQTESGAINVVFPYVISRIDQTRTWKYN